MTPEQTIEIGKYYYLADGTQVFAEAQTTDGKFVVHEECEGETMTAKCYGGPVMEFNVPYTHEGRIHIVNAHQLFSKVPVASKVEEIIVLTDAINALRDVKKELLISNEKLGKGLSARLQSIEAAIGEAENRKAEAEVNLENAKAEIERFNCLSGVTTGDPDVTKDGMIIISLSEFLDLTRRAEKYNALDAGGVDNWEWYQESLEKYKKDNGFSVDEYIGSLCKKLLERIEKITETKPEGGA